MKTDNLTSSFLALRDRLHRSALGFLKDDEEAKDALQDTYVNLWSHGGAQSEPEARNKLFAALKNVCIDRLRKPRTLPIDDTDTASLASTPESGEDMERYETLLTAGLSDLQRHVYSLVIHDGLEYETVARQLGMTVEAVRMQMSRARKRIRDNYRLLEK